MSDPKSNNRALFAKWALALFIIGILGAIFILAFSPRQGYEAKEFALMLIVFSWLFALVFGTIGWRHTAHIVNKPESTNRALFAKWALALFIIGFLGAILILAFSPRRGDEGEGFALMFLVISELMGLVFGIIGWRHTAGKVAVIGIAALFAHAGVKWLRHHGREDGARKAVPSVMERELRESGAPATPAPAVTPKTNRPAPTERQHQ